MLFSKASGKACRLFASILLVFSIVPAFRSICFCTGSSSITLAENQMKRAFNATLSAEQAGANVSGLISKLNEAGVLLAEAEMAQRNGDLGQAVAKANSSLSLTQEVLGDCLVLREEALARANETFWTTLAYSSGAIVAFVVLYAIAWRWFKRFYMRRVSESRPEVTLDAETR